MKIQTDFNSTRALISISNPVLALKAFHHGLKCHLLGDARIAHPVFPEKLLIMFCDGALEDVMLVNHEGTTIKAACIDF